MCVMIDLLLLLVSLMQPNESMPFKVLHCSFMFPRRSFGFERAQIPSLAGLRILLPRIESITARLKFPDHVDSPVLRRTPTQILPSRVSTLKLFRSTLAGPWVTFPVRPSKHELCQGHWTLKPSKAPSDNGPKRCVQNSWNA